MCATRTLLLTRLPLCAAEKIAIMRSFRRGLSEHVVRVPQPRLIAIFGGNPAGAVNRGRLFLGYFLLAKQKKVTSRRATPGKWRAVRSLVQLKGKGIGLTFDIQVQHNNARLDTITAAPE